MSDSAPRPALDSRATADQSKEVLSALARIAMEKLELKPEQLQGLSPALPIVEGLQLDSLAQVTLIAAIEDEFGFEIEIEEREHIQTAGDLVELICRRATRGLHWC